ncbi:hypothetical protein EV421DRAFT_1740173 [Armillaria borealis]|uniref:Uncharacterized protein n=1 Tax=Armillaria borealis TaxID=47425 RepID=A0AA39J671_9AGAR|nr:hypothetical protein EV421DRAFT_1740173 [Armillaria borealis]
MSSPLHSHATCDEIRQRVQNLCRFGDGGVMPLLLPNDVPHPDALCNSGIYYPLLPSVATTHLNYLHNSLSHPSVTGPLSFHAIVLSTNHALRLETDVIRGQRVQRTHAFNASLAKLQGLDGLPISSHVGHAVIFFFLGEHECEDGTDENWNDLLIQQIACLNPEDTGPVTPAYEEDSDDEDCANGPGVLVQSQARTGDDKGDRNNEGRDMPAVRRRNSYPPDTNVNTESQLVPDTTLDEDDNPGNETQLNDTVHSYTYQVADNYQGELAQETLPIPIPRALRRIPPPPHPALPLTFILPVQQIISVKHDEARGVFRIPRDYSLRMTNPILEMPPFRATVFVLETYEPTELASSQSSSDDDDEQDKKSKRGEDDEDDDPESSERDRTTAKRRRVESQEERDGDQLMYPASPPGLTDENFRPPTPVPSVLLQPPVQALSSLEPTSMPPTVAEETSASTAAPNVFAAQLQIIHIPPADLDVEMSESSRPFSINPAIVAPEGQYRGPAERTQGEEDENFLTSEGVGDEWEHFDSEMKSLTPAEPMDTVDPKLIMASPAASSGMSITSSRNSSPLYESTQPRIVDDDSSSEGSEYETSDSSPPSSSDSRPSLTSDDSDAYSPLSLEELTRETNAALDDLPDELRHFTCQTLTAVGRGDSNALTYSICQHDKAGNLIQEPAPYVPEPSILFPCDNLDSEFVFQVMETFQGPCDNSPLQNGSANELINPFGASFDTLRGLDEYKISKIALKIYDLIMDLDIYLDQWNGTHPHLTISELEIIRLTIFRVSDTPAATRIINREDAPANHKPPPPRVLIFMRPEEMMPGREHIADALRNRDALETYKPLDDEPAYSFLDPTKSPIPEVYKNPWIPFLTAQWRRAVDRLSPEDEAHHFLYSHHDIFRYLEPGIPSYFQGFHHRCLHINPTSGTLWSPLPSRNPLLTANEDEFIYHAVALFEFEGRGELANALRFAHAAEPILPAEVRMLFSNGYVEPIKYYNAQGRQCAFRGDQLDLSYYAEEV